MKGLKALPSRPISAALACALACQGSATRIGTGGAGRGEEVKGVVPNAQPDKVNRHRAQRYPAKPHTQTASRRVLRDC